ncbi:MAG: 3-deoxy-D-manno-octulosonate 8-phosphate phosphatase [Flavobacteriales bacterium CG_4_9_14_3_um_filter_40_17]|nr:MAG: 3-deoxy-D-manno-octulosonate 8-phosphate phosphatase [Flavobacteriales bacterium CG_4_9_14_3_um_filter_40_17]
MKNYKEYLGIIKTFVLDVDGVLTDGRFQISNDGELLRSMNTKDGFAVKYAIELGYRFCVISGGVNEGVRLRLREMGITDIYFGIVEKDKALQEFFEDYGIDPASTLYMGDDILDMAAMKMVALPACPQDAVPEVKQLSLYVSHRNGGQGCVRDIIEQVLKVQGKWKF